MLIINPSSIMVMVLMGKLKTAPRQAHFIFLLLNTLCNTPMILMPITASVIPLVTLREVGVDPAAVSRALRRLTDQELVERGPGPRRYLLLTQKGRELSETISTVFEQRCLRLVANITPHQLAEVQSSLEVFKNNLEQVAALSSEWPNSF